MNLENQGKFAGWIDERAKEELEVCKKQKLIAFDRFRSDEYIREKERKALIAMTKIEVLKEVMDKFVGYIKSEG